MVQWDRLHGILAGALAHDQVLGLTAGWASQRGCRSLGAGALACDRVLGSIDSWASQQGANQQGWRCQTWDCPPLACALASGWLGILWTSIGKYAGSRGLEA